MPEFDFGAVVQATHFAFRRVGAGFDGGGGAYRASPSATGRVAITPRDQRAGRAAKSVVAWREGSALVLETTSARRDAALLTTAGRSERSDDGHVVVSRGGLVEHLRNRSEGLEQSWSFAEPPAGQGSLGVTVAVRGEQRYAGRTVAGLHFADPATGLGFRYGDAVWVDASGRRTPIVARFDPARRDGGTPRPDAALAEPRPIGTVVLEVPADVLASSSYPAVLDPIVSPEFGIDRPVTVFADGGQASPSVAWNGTHFLVAWADSRLAAAPASDIYACRLLPDGTLLEKTGFIVSHDTDGRFAPVVASDGANFLIAWVDGRKGTGDIYASRVTDAGTVLDAAGIPIAATQQEQQAPALTWGNGTYLIAWQDQRAGTWDIYANRVHSDGKVLDGDGFAVSLAARDQVAPAVAADGAGFFVAWQDGRTLPVAQIYGARVSVNGAALDPAGLLLAGAAAAQAAPAIAFDGTNYLVAWQDLRGGRDWDLRGARVKPSGALLDVNGFAIAAPPGNQQAPSLAYDGAEFLIAWQDDRSGNSNDIYAGRVSPNATVLDPLGVPVTTAALEQTVPRIAFGGGVAEVVWQDLRNGSPSVYGARMRSDTRVLDPGGTLYSTTANRQAAPATAFDGTRYLVVWQDFRGGGDLDVFGARVDALGVVLDPLGIAINQDPGDQVDPSAAFDGTQFLVAWSSGSMTLADVAAARVRPSDGAVLDPTGAAIAVSRAPAGQNRPRVASDGAFSLVVWYDGRSRNDWDIYGARVRALDGAVMEPNGIPISVRADDQFEPAVSFGAGRYFVAWEDSRSLRQFDIYGARVQPNGVVTDATGIPIATSPPSKHFPAVAYGANEFLLGWEEDAGLGLGLDIRGARVDSNGAVLDGNGLAITAAQRDQSRVAASFDGRDFVLAWEDARNLGRDIYAARVHADGTLEDPTGIGVAVDLTDKATPAMASDELGRTLIAYARFDPLAPFSATRARARVLTNLAPGAACGSDGECGEGACVMGRCGPALADGGPPALDAATADSGGGARADLGIALSTDLASGQADSSSATDAERRDSADGDSGVVVVGGGCSCAVGGDERARGARTSLAALMAALVLTAHRRARRRGGWTGLLSARR